MGMLQVDSTDFWADFKENITETDTEDLKI